MPGLKRLLSFGSINRRSRSVRPGGDVRAAIRLSLLRSQPEDIAALSYTGGTTGAPKGVMTTYRGSSTMAQIMLAEWQWPDELRHLVCTPLSHAGASLVVPVLVRGGSVVVLPRFDAAAVLEAIERYRITSVMLVPSMIYALLDHPKFADHGSVQPGDGVLRCVADAPARLQEAIRKMGRIFFQFYGQTEAPQTVCVLRKEEHDPDDLARLATCGRPVPWVHVALLDDDGQEVERGEPGEICVRGQLVMKGYQNKPERDGCGPPAWLAPHR